MYSPLHYAREEGMHMIQRAVTIPHRECSCNGVVRIHGGELDGLNHLKEMGQDKIKSQQETLRAYGFLRVPERTPTRR